MRTKLYGLLLLVIVAVTGLALASDAINDAVDTTVSQAEVAVETVEDKVDSYNESLRELGIR